MTLGASNRIVMREDQIVQTVHVTLGASNRIVMREDQVLHVTLGCIK